MKLQDYGAWLQGALTPLALLIAAAAFLEQAFDQRKANNINMRSHVIGSLSAFVGHLNYLCAASLRAQYVSRDEIADENPLSAMRYLLITCADDRTPGWNKATIHGHSYADLQNRQPFVALRDDTRQIMQQAEEAGYAFLLDNRIKEMAAAFDVIQRRER